MTSSNELSKEMKTINEKVIDILQYTNKEIKELQNEVASMNLDSTKEIKNCWNNNFSSCEDYLKDFKPNPSIALKSNKTSFLLASSFYLVYWILCSINFNKTNTL